MGGDDNFEEEEVAEEDFAFFDTFEDSPDFEVFAGDCGGVVGFCVINRWIADCKEGVNAMSHGSPADFCCSFYAKILEFQMH